MSKKIIKPASVGKSTITMGAGTMFIGDVEVAKLSSVEIAASDEIHPEPARITARMTVESDPQMDAAIAEVGRRMKAGERVIPLQEVIDVADTITNTDPARQAAEPTAVEQALGISVPDPIQLTPEILERRARVGKKMREEHIQRTIKTPGARRRQIRFRLFSSVCRDPLIQAHEQTTLQGIIQKLRGHAIPDTEKQVYVSPNAMVALQNGERVMQDMLADLETDDPPADAYRLPQNVLNAAMASFYIRKIIGNKARAQNPKLPPWPPSEAELDAAERARIANHPMDRAVGEPQWVAAVGQGRSIGELCKAAFSGG